MLIVGIDLVGVPEPRALQRLQDPVNRALAGRAKPLSPPSFPAAVADSSGMGTAPVGTGGTAVSRKAVSAPDAEQPRFPGREYHVDVRGAQGVQIGDNNIQINRR